ncbi:hypothetical protein EG834_19435 [bacterium]|nr:hypothetical protein [bacterium]
MMNKPERLLTRLNVIGKALSKKEGALALIGLGSVGLEVERLDQYSDLDFFVIVTAGSKPRFLDDLTWLSEIAPVAYSFPNTPDGFKLLYADGIYCEFAVFEQVELAQAVFSPGRVVWKAGDIPDQIALPQHPHRPKPRSSTEWLIGEALTNLYVGLSRDRRGEKLSAMRFIQHYAVDRILELSEQIEAVGSIAADEFNLERRYEQRVPQMVRVLPELLQGYERNRDSALAALDYLDRNFKIDPAMKEAILGLCRPME